MRVLPHMPGISKEAWCCPREMGQVQPLRNAPESHGASQATSGKSRCLRQMLLKHGKAKVEQRSQGTGAF